MRATKSGIVPSAPLSLPRHSTWVTTRTAAPASMNSSARTSESLVGIIDGLEVGIKTLMTTEDGLHGQEDRAHTRSRRRSAQRGLPCRVGYTQHSSAAHDLHVLLRHRLLREAPRLRGPSVDPRTRPSARSCPSRTVQRWAKGSLTSIPSPCPCLKVTEDENPLAGVGDPVGIQRDLVPRRVELIVELLESLTASIQGVEIRKGAGEVELDIRCQERGIAVEACR